MMKVPTDENDRYPERKWNTCSICLTVAVVLLIIAIIAIISIFVVYWHGHKTKLGACDREDCVVTASTFIQSMNMSLDPCKDFYKFSCDGFVRKNPVPDHEVSKSAFMQYVDVYQRQLRDMIETINIRGQPNVMERAQEAYHVCINTVYNPSDEMEAFKAFIHDDLGTWPLLEGKKWNPSWRKPKLIGKLLRTGFPIGFHFAIRSGSKNKARKRLWLLPDKPEDEMYSSYLPSSAMDSQMKSEHLSGLQNSTATHLGKLLKLLGAEKVDEEAIEKSENDLMDLATINYEYRSDEDDSDESEEDEEEEEEYEPETDEEKFDFKDDQDPAPDEEKDHKESDEDDEDAAFAMSLGKLASSIKDKEKRIDWVRVLNTLFEDIANFTNKDIIYVNKDYAKKINKYLASNNVRSLYNAFLRKIVMTVSKNGGPDIEQLHDDFEKDYMIDEYKAPKRWEKCVEWLQDAYRFPIARLFINEYINPIGRGKVDEMIELVRTAYKEMISQSSWIDQETKQRAINKADMVKKYISYPDFIFDDIALENYYDYFPSVHQIHFKNFIDQKRNHTLLVLKTFKEPREESLWTFNPLMVKAFYDWSQNSIWFPTGILQLPFFDVTRPAIVNFGMIGSVIGHELGHGFDNTGRKYDELGRKKNWWSKDTKKEYLRRADCFIKQYSNFCPSELQAENHTYCVDGQNTLGENIADFTGLKAALLAYKHWVRKYGTEQQLTGLTKFSAEQLFFISYAARTCENMPIDRWKMRYSGDVQSPSYYRVIGPLSNMEEFADAFHCPVGTMNSGSSRCEMW